VHAARTDLPLLQVDRPRPDRFDKSSLHLQQSCLRNRPSPVTPGGGTLSPALAAAPAGAALGNHQVIGRQ